MGDQTGGGRWRGFWGVIFQETTLGEHNGEDDFEVTFQETKLREDNAEDDGEDNMR